MVDSTNTDLANAGMTAIARQFRHEISSVVQKYEQILIDYEKKLFN